jgi:2-keto-4-pentenoate hydratase/2-oxohepta-3-ene-1,7-dioic acid hydratase in catechol pathway
VDYEAELAVVIGKRLERPTIAQAQAGIFAATCLNDVTARPLQRKDVQWTRAKGFDTFCPVGPWLITGLELQTLQVQSYVNNQLRQDGNTSQQIWDVITLVHFISHVMTLEPGDLIATGTPEGVGPLVAGDQVEVRIEGIGSLKNTVKDAG